MKKYVAVGTVLLFAFAWVMPVMAHDGWSQTNSPIIEPGEHSYVELQFGNHSNEHRSYRIDGTWSAEETDLNVTTPDGDVVDIADTLFYMGETTEVNEDRLGVNNYHVGSFSAESPGIYIVSAEMDSIFKHGDSASRTLRSAKSFVAVNDIPTFSAVHDFDGYDRQVTPDRAEIIPQFNPTAITPDQEVAVQLLKEGEPLANEEVSIIRRSTSEAETLTTDEKGLVCFTTGPADYYLLRAKPVTDEGVEGEYDKLNYEATMTFTVQNGSGVSVEEIGHTLESNTDEGEQHTDTSPDETDPVDSGANPGNETTLLQNPLLYVYGLLGLTQIGTLIALFRK